MFPLRLKAALCIIAITLYSVLISSCSPLSEKNVAQKNSRSSSTPSTDAFPSAHKNFTVYQQNILKYLTKNSLRQRSTADIALNMPFQIKANAEVPYRGRFLLFHGLNNSTFIWQDFAQHIAQQGFDVRAVLLKGHGSHPRNMLDVTASDWLHDARAHYNAWMAEPGAHDKANYLGGFSMGAVLASYLALEQQEVKGLLLVSPAYHSKLNNMLRFSWLYSLYQPWLFGGMITEDNPTKYNSISINAAFAYYELTQKLKAKWGSQKLSMPVLMLHSINDSVVDVDYSRKIFQQKMTNSKNKLLLFATATTPLSLKPNEEKIDSNYLSLRILNQSHLSLINSSDNPLMGEAGTQLICNGNEYPIYMACMNSAKHWYGAQHTLSPDGVAVARTTYNPDFMTVTKRFNELFLPLQ